jgi:Mg2+/Co2+ transporter CorB
MSATTIQICLILFLMVLSAYLSMSETALLTASDSKLHTLKKKNSKGANRVIKLRSNKEGLLGVILLLNTLVNIGASSISTGLFIELFGDNPESLLYSTLLMTALILIYGEILPKTLAVRNSEKISLFVSPVISFLIIILKPITTSVQLLVNITLKVFTRPTPEQEKLSGLDLIKGTIEMHHEQGMMVSEDKHMLGGLVDLEKITVNEIMVHRNDFHSVSIDEDPKKIVNYILKNSHSRILIWKKNPENIIGIIHIKDLISLIRKQDKILKRDVEKIMRKPWFIPAVNNLKMQLSAFREHQAHLAIVVDEYGEILGLLTLEDILEEVVGHIEDEYDNSRKHKITRNSTNTVTVYGELSIRDLNREMNWEISDSHAATIGGYIFHIAQRIPDVGDTFKIDTYKFKVIKKELNKISKVRVQKIALPSKK